MCGSNREKRGNLPHDGHDDVIGAHHHDLCGSGAALQGEGGGVMVRREGLSVVDHLTKSRGLGLTGRQGVTAAGSHKDLEILTVSFTSQNIQRFQRVLFVASRHAAMKCCVCDRTRRDGARKNKEGVKAELEKYQGV